MESSADGERGFHDHITLDSEDAQNRECFPVNISSTSDEDL